MQALGGIISGKVNAKELADLLPIPGLERTKKDDEEEVAFSTGSRIKRRGKYQPLGAYTIASGNDDFALYMQHQQGVSGAAGIMKAFTGTGQMNPETIETRGGVKYANLVNNIPSDQPQVKRDLIAALDAGDQQTAAALFINMWKGKWNSMSKTALSEINKPKNAEVKEAIEKACQKHGVPFEFAATVAFIESGFNPKAGNPTFKGLFAMKPESSYGGVVSPMGKNWSDPEVNAEAGVRLLKDGIKKFKSQMGPDLAALQLSPWAKSMA